LKGFFEIHYW